MASSMQRYISKELTHFVGRKLAFETDQYDLLMKILKEGWLTHENHTPNVSGNLWVNMSAKMSQNEMYSLQMVCFCDIPKEDLALHTEKYSRFGLSFDKDFIVEKGGTPVYYLPKEAKVDLFFQKVSKGAYFDKMIQDYHELSQLFHTLIMKSSTTAGVPKDSHRLQELEFFFNFHILSQVQFFDHRLADNDPNNYYFEREWRVIGNVQFNIEDVKRILIPREYGKAFRQDCPQYHGELTFLD